MTHPPDSRRSWFWFVGFLIWFVTLWFLSSQPTPELEDGYKIPHLDKVLHFGYFLGGAGLLSAVLYLLPRRPPRRPGWDTIHVCVIVVITLIGVLDEWHQSWYPFRSGNDAADLAADFLGAVAGTLLFRRFCHILDSGNQEGIPMQSTNVLNAPDGAEDV